VESERPLSAAKSSITKNFKKNDSNSDVTGKNSKARKRTRKIVEEIEAIPLEKPIHPEDQERDEKVRENIPKLRKIQH
jgi:hypothetical protein